MIQVTAWTDANTKAAPTSEDMDGGGTDLAAGDTVNLATKSLSIDKSVGCGHIDVVLGTFDVVIAKVLTLDAGAHLIVGGISAIAGTVLPSATSTISLVGGGVVGVAGVLGVRTNKYTLNIDVTLTVLSGGIVYLGQLNGAVDIDCQTGGSVIADASAATGMGGSITIIFDSNASSGYGTGGGTVTYKGDATYRVYEYEAGRLTIAGDGVVTDLGAVQGISGGSGILVATYAHIFHRRTLPKAGTTTLTDSEYWFTNTGTAPVEQIVSGTWTLVRSLISSYASKLWYVKPTGTLSLTNSFLDHCLPSLYSANYYIPWYQMPSRIIPVPPEKVTATDVFMGSSGEYSETIAYKSEGVEVEGRVIFQDLAMWNHALDHRVFVARMNELLADVDEIPKFTWHQGHYAKCELVELIAKDLAGEDFNVSSRTYSASIRSRPYN